MKNLRILGAGGFAKEVYYLAKQCGYEDIAMLDRGEEDHVLGNNDLVIGIGKSSIRQYINDYLLQHYRVTNYTKLIAPSANLMDMETIKIGGGAVICANSILTTNIQIGIHSQINLATTIGHDCVIGDYFTTAPGVHISGHCIIGDRVYFGTNSCAIEGITICDDVIIGAGTVVIRDIVEPGTYVGSPAKKVK